MKNLFKLTLVTCFALLIVGCEEDLLNNSGESGVSQPTFGLTSAQLEFGTTQNPAILAAFVDGIYAQMIQVNSGGSPGRNDTDLGHKGYDIISDMLCGDMALTQSGFGWYRADWTEYQAPTDFTRFNNSIAWTYYYRIIRSANIVIQNLGGNDIVPDPGSDAAYAMGQAKALRAYGYYYLAQFYQKEYVASELILPIYTEPGGVNFGKSTAEEIYDLIESDLTEAITLLNGFNRSAKNQVNQDVARALLAYALGAKGGEDAMVASLTQQVIGAGNHSIMPLSNLTTTGFVSVADPSWLWGIDITENNGLGLLSWWGQVDAFSFSYAWAGDFKAMDESLYNSMRPDDARRNQFLNDPTNTRHLQPLSKFFASNTIGGTSTTVTADYVYMRIEEMYLLNAEANARLGNTADARASLLAVASERIGNTSYINSLSGQALLDEIYLQTRLEFWGEGKSYLAMKRNKATINRGSNHLSFVGEDIPYNDERMQMEIPLIEIQNNPFLSDQNQ